MFIFTSRIIRHFLLATVALSTIGLTRTSIAQSPNSSTLLPFFDTERNPIPVDFPVGAKKDITPPPPTVERFDERILTMCGTDFNAPVREQDFRKLMQDYPDVVQKLQTATKGELQPDRQNTLEFLDDLITIWFAEQGFKHIFCGEISGRAGDNSRDNIGGLHLAARYWQLQQAGLAGRAVGQVAGEESVEEVVDGVIYTFATVIKRGDRIIAQHHVKGYSYVLNAQDLLIHTTKAFKLSHARFGDEKFACLYTVNAPETAPFTAVFVQSNNAIVTFYPDATPNSSRTKGACEPSS